jgi:hypothetical protein
MECLYQNWKCSGTIYSLNFIDSNACRTERIVFGVSVYGSSSADEVRLTLAEVKVIADQAVTTGSFSSW